MMSWYHSLYPIQRVYALIAIPSTTLVILQTVLLFFDRGNVYVQGGDKAPLFSPRAVTAMLCIAGWSAIAMTELGTGAALSAVCSILIGLSALFGISSLQNVLFMRLREDMRFPGLIGKTGQVYNTVPANMRGYGKISIVQQSKYTEFTAMTKERIALKTGESVRIVAAEAGFVTVERIKSVHNKELHRFGDFTV